MRLAPVLKKLSEYCNPRKKITWLRHIDKMKGNMTSSQNWQKNVVQNVNFKLSSPGIFNKGYDCV